jgi:hypothetical protein
MHELLGRTMPGGAGRLRSHRALRRQARPRERAQGDLAAAFASLAADTTTRAKYLGVTRDTQDPALRVRMITLAR